MAKPLEMIMGSIPMTTAAQTVTRGIPTKLPPAFYRVTRRVRGNQVAYQTRAGGRAAAKLVQYGAPSVLVGGSAPSEAAAVLIHSFEHERYPMQMLNNLRSGDPMLQQMAQDDIDAKTGDFMERYNTLRVAAIGSLLGNGRIWFDGNGEFLPTSAGAVTTLNAGIPANNLNQLNGIIAASWALAGTDIISHITNLKKVALQTTGMPLKHVFYGSNIPGYLAANTAIKSYLTAAPALAQALYTTGEIAPGFMGLEWHPVYESFTVSAGGTLSETYGGDYVGFTPEPSPAWYEFVEGSYLVPSSVEVQPTVQAAMANLREVTGKFSYGTVAHDPVGIVHYAGDTFVPIIKNPAAIYIADVTP